MRLLKYALKNIIRTPFLSLSTTTVISLLTFLIFVLFFVDFVTRSLTDSINSRLSLTLTVKSTLTDTSREIVDILDQIRKIQSGVEARFISAEAAFETLKARDPDLARVIESDDKNPLPSTIAIKNIPLERYADLDTLIAMSGEVIDIEDDVRKKSFLGYKEQYERIKKVIEILTGLQYGLYTVILFFLFSVFIIVFQSIGNAVFYFREEIKITELVGGQQRYIYGPFIIQGIIYTVVALLLSGALFFVGLRSLDLSAIITSPIFLDRFLTESITRFLALSGGVVFLGALSGLVASYRFVRK